MSEGRRMLHYVPADGCEFMCVIWVASNGEVVKTYDEVYDAKFYPNDNMLEIRFRSASRNASDNSVSTILLVGSSFAVTNYALVGDE